MPPAARVATFDNDGTLWYGKPLPIQAEYAFRHLAAMATTVVSIKSDWAAVFADAE